MSKVDEVCGRIAEEHATMVAQGPDGSGLVRAVAWWKALAEDLLDDALVVVEALLEAKKKLEGHPPDLTRRVDVGTPREWVRLHDGDLKDRCGRLALRQDDTVPTLCELTEERGTSRGANAPVAWVGDRIMLTSEQVAWLFQALGEYLGVIKLDPEDKEAEVKLEQWLRDANARLSDVPGGPRQLQTDQAFALTVVDRLRRELALSRLELAAQVPALLEAVQENLQRAVKAERIHHGRWALVNTDSYGGDYPDERFVARGIETKEQAEKMAAAINDPHGRANRYAKVVQEPYALVAGFQP